MLLLIENLGAHLFRHWSYIVTIILYKIEDKKVKQRQETVDRSKNESNKKELDDGWP